MTTFTQYEVALFIRAPSIGEFNPEGEIYYTGYKRVLMTGDKGANLDDVVFPESEQDEKVFASHAVVFDGSGRVVGVTKLREVIGT